MPIFPFSSVIAIGVADIPFKWNVTIGNSGKARPIPSQSTKGMPSFAATTIGIIELTPPASIGKVPAIVSWSKYFPNFSKTRTNSSPLGNFSIATDGAPIIAAGRKKSSAAISSGETSLTGPFSSMADKAIILPM